MKDEKDEKLIRETQAGNIRAYEVIVRRYQGKLFSFVYRLVGEEEAAEEIIQDTLFNVYKKVDHIDTTKKFSTYIFEIAKNGAISYLRKRKITIPLEDYDLVDLDESIYGKMAKLDEKNDLQKALTKLGQKYQRIIRLYYFDDLSYEEIGSKLKIPLNTVRTHLHRAKKLLRKIFNNENH